MASRRDGKSASLVVASLPRADRTTAAAAAAIAANNYADTLVGLDRFEEAKSLMRKTLPVARRVLGDSNDTTLRTRWMYAMALYDDPAAPLDDIREAVVTLEETERTAQRVFGGAHPLTKAIGRHLPLSRAALDARETPSPCQCSVS